MMEGRFEKLFEIAGLVGVASGAEQEGATCEC